MRRASWTASEQAAQLRQQGDAGLPRPDTTCLARQRREELTDDHARGTVEQAAADARHLAADRRLIDVADRCAAILGRNEGDAPLPATESERAFGGPAQRDSMRRIEIGQFHVGAVSPLYRTDAERHVGAEMCVRYF